MHKRISYTFRVICDAEMPTTWCYTIFGRPGVAEPALREEFATIFATLFPGKVRIEISAIEEIPRISAALKTNTKS